MKIRTPTFLMLFCGISAIIYCVIRNVFHSTTFMAGVLMGASFIMIIVDLIDKERII